ncbi:PEP-CTERM sorting domain-containing protein [Sphingomonas sp. RS6]
MAVRAGGIAAIASLMLTTSAGIAVAPVAAAFDALAMLSARSPGVREVGAVNTKLARGKMPLVLAGEPPVMAPPVDSEFAPIPAAAALPADNPLTEVAGGNPIGGTDSFTTSDSFTPIGGGFGGGGPGGPVGIVPGGGGGGGGGGVPTPTPTPTTPVSPVPEPGIWAMMIAALFVLGGLARRQSRSETAVG